MTALRSCTLGTLLEEIATRRPNNAAMAFQGVETTYQVLYARAQTIAKGFLRYGMHKGSHIVIWSTDRPNTLACFYACALIGAVAVLPNTSLKQREMCELLLASDADLLLFGDGYKDVSFPAIVEKLPPLPRIERCFYIGEGSQPSASDLEALIQAGDYISDDALANAVSCVRPEDTAAMLFTSGTAGASKGVLTSHYSRVNSAIGQASDLMAREQDRFLVAIPLFHCFSLSANILAALSVGACVVFPENRRAESILTCIERTRCTVFHAVPTLLSALLARPDLDSFDRSSLRIGLVGGALPSPKQLRAFRERLGYEILPSLGLTEATAGITVARPSDPLCVKLETVGHFMDNIEGRILSRETGAPCRVGEVGEICVRGYCVMQGYYASAALTRTAIDENGFLHTGDMGYLDADGNVHFVGRDKEIIVRGGENIYPCEIESCILEDERVREVRVVGMPDEHYGEVVCACVVAAPNARLTEDEVRDRVQNALATYKTPKYVLFYDTLPKGASSKISLRELGESLTSRLRAISSSTKPV